MKSREQLTNIDKRKLTYDRFDKLRFASGGDNKAAHPLDLPREF